MRSSSIIVVGGGQTASIGSFGCHKLLVKVWREEKRRKRRIRWLFQAKVSSTPHQTHSSEGVASSLAHSSLLLIGGATKRKAFPFNLFLCDARNLPLHARHFF